MDAVCVRLLGEQGLHNAVLTFVPGDPSEIRSTRLPLHRVSVRYPYLGPSPVSGLDRMMD